MEDGVKGDPGGPKEVHFLSKAGWVKKATGRLLAGYKLRYIHVEKTEVVVYEDEDLKNCLERLDLENFEKCLELKSLLLKKNRLILIRAPKCANKIHDVKIQVQTPEEKDAWIKALSEGIDRAKNKIFDAVKVDESNNLDHVTRTRPKGNRNRRPPTRIHMKEVANVSSEGILRLDLDVPDARLSNGNHYVNVDFEDPPKDIPTPPTSPSSTSSRDQEEPQTVVEPNPQKKIIKPPMPPSKNKAVSANENGPSMQDGPEKVPGPPKPPSKELKPSLLPAEENIMSEDVPVAGASEKTDPPMNPPTKPMSSSMEILPEALSPVQETSHPTIPPIDKKPISDPERKGFPLTLEATSDEITVSIGNTDPTITQHEDSPSSASELETTSVPSVCSTDIEESPYDIPRVVLTLSEPVAVKPDLSQPTCGFPAEDTEEISKDSICQSDAASVDSGSEDTLASSTFALRGSQVGLDSFNASEDDGEDYNKPEQIRDAAPPGPMISQVTSSVQVNRGRAQPSKLGPPIPCKPKSISTSVGDLLSNDSAGTEERQQSRDISKSDSGDGLNMVKNLERKIALELVQTKELLRCTSQKQGEGLGKNVPEDLLAKAVKKLRMADHCLREAKNLEESRRLTSKNSSRRPRRNQTM